MMSRCSVGSLLVVACLIAASTGETPKPPQFELPKPEAPRTRFQPQVSISGNNPGNFGGYVGGSIEHDLVRRGPHTLTGSASGGKAIARDHGHTFNSKPDYNVGIKYKYSF